MTILQIKCFMETAKTGSFSKAARNMWLSQQSVCKQINRLEKELGFMLFERNNRGVSITKEGEILFADWQMILEYLHRSEEKIKDFQSMRK